VRFFGASALIFLIRSSICALSSLGGGDVRLDKFAARAVDAPQARRQGRSVIGDDDIARALNRDASSARGRRRIWPTACAPPGLVVDGGVARNVDDDRPARGSDERAPSKAFVNRSGSKRFTARACFRQIAFPPARIGRASPAHGRKASIKRSPSFSVSERGLSIVSDAVACRWTNADSRIRPIEPGAGDLGRGIGLGEREWVQTVPRARRKGVAFLSARAVCIWLYAYPGFVT
jgi:hypothetical protein